MMLLRWLLTILSRFLSRLVQFLTFELIFAESSVLWSSGIVFLTLVHQADLDRSYPMRCWQVSPNLLP